MLKGSCLCGDVTFTVTGAPHDPAACHCSQCRKMSGHGRELGPYGIDDFLVLKSLQL